MNTVSMKFFYVACVLPMLLNGGESQQLLGSFSTLSDGNSVMKTEDPMFDAKHGVKMGVSNSGCDDAKTNLEVDWNDNPINYTCFNPKKRLPLRRNLPPILECEDVPSDYMPQHYCMDKKLDYDEPFPTHASHRPLWPVYGEYKFVPPQRWSHSLEHGSVVMLYHPCTHPRLVQKLKKIIKKCIRKHVIAASNLVPEKYPLLMLAWGCRLRMSNVNERIVTNFIKTKSLKGPEGMLSKEGQYDHLIIEKATIPVGSTFSDSIICPKGAQSSSPNSF